MPTDRRRLKTAQGRPKLALFQLFELPVEDLELTLHLFDVLFQHEHALSLLPTLAKRDGAPPCVQLISAAERDVSAIWVTFHTSDCYVHSTSSTAKSRAPAMHVT